MDEGYLHSDVASTALVHATYPAESVLRPPPPLKTVRAPQPQRVAPPAPPRRWPPLLPVLLPFLALVLLAFVVAHEFRTSQWQAEQLAPHAKRMTWTLGPGRSNSIVFPEKGPFDLRHGYARLPKMLERLEARGFAIVNQARMSPEMASYAQRGYFPPYPEKTQAGVTVRDGNGTPIYRFRYPEQGYATFADIPPLVWRTLLFIENRDLLDPTREALNPAVDWPRFATAAFWRAFKIVGLSDHSSAGASTLATQLEKYRHSPDGLTRVNTDKLRQMVSASVRAYRDGPDTLATRERIVRDYLNSVPLSAYPGYGEVHGLADGLRVWFGTDFEAVNRALAPGSTAPLAERGRALRQVVSLVIAQRRPSYYLDAGRVDLATLTDAHLRLLASEGMIDEELRDAAIGATMLFADEWNSPPEEMRPPGHSRATNVARAHLAGLLDVPLYDLDRMDVEASTTLDTELQRQINEHLTKLLEPDYAAQNGLVGEYLLKPAMTGDVRYSFTLYERTGNSYRVRVQTDSTAQAFDINEHSKLELGSTAKLRVLTTYLEVIAELHTKYAGMTPQQLRAVRVADDDVLSRWALDWLATARQKDLATMLHAALERRYSAAPWESFFTGGGLHTFANFRPEDNYRIPTMREALQDSINLPFIRVLRDVIRYFIYQGPGNRDKLFVDDRDPGRMEYLAKFADREGTIYLRRFWNRYAKLSSQERLAAFLGRVHPTEARYSAVHRYLSPEAGEGSFGAFLDASLPDPKRKPERTAELYRTFARGEFTLTDQAYVAGIHPMELWLVSYLLQRPDASFSDAVAASREERQQIYGWLMKSRHRQARDSRVRIMLEEEAFQELHKRWRALGYPFERLVPSLATAIGSSGDRPAALAELMGIIRNDGVRLPTLRVDRIRFGADTPYETLVEHAGRPTRVIAPEVAAALRVALADVVGQGTARRLQGAFVTEDGEVFALGGKTGTGDNRIEAVGRNGQVLSSTAVNRTATFVFYLGDNHVGTITAFVPGAAAEKFTFTSALPVQVLKSMAPMLVPYLDGGVLRPVPLPETRMAAAPAPAPTSAQALGLEPLPAARARPGDAATAMGPPASADAGQPVTAPASAQPQPAYAAQPSPAPVAEPAYEPTPEPEPAFRQPALFDADAPPEQEIADEQEWEPAPMERGRTDDREWTEWPDEEPAHAESRDDSRYAESDDEWIDDESSRTAESMDYTEPEVDADTEEWIDGEDDGAYDEDGEY